MKKLLLSLLIIVGVVSAQNNLNYKGWGDTAQFVSFKADSLFMSKAFILSNAENKSVLVLCDDTSNAGRGGDSCVFEVGMELGWPTATLTGAWDTTWTNRIPQDTFDLMNTAQVYNPLLGTGAAPWAYSTSTEMYTRPMKQLDTTLTGGGSALCIPLSPHWAPYIRFYAKGLTKNKLGRFLKARFVFEQRSYVYTRSM